VELLTLPPEALGADLEAPRLARREVRRFLDRNLGCRHDDVLLVISELITQRHPRAGGVGARVARRPGTAAAVIVEVRDPSPALPVERAPDLAVRGGRGIRLVSAIADKWGVEMRGEAGKTVWAEFRASG